MSIDDFSEENKEHTKPIPLSERKYDGMSREAAEDYEKRQDEPLMKKASEMFPMEQVKAYHETLLCGYHKRDGCKLLTRDKSFYACMWHQAIQAIGTEFFWYYSRINDNEFQAMTNEQTRKLEKHRIYMQRWMDNFPNGATM